MSLTEDFGEVLDELSDPDLLPSTMTWAGNDYTCFRSSIKKDAELEAGGWGVEEDISITVAANKFAADDRPSRGESLTTSSTTYRIKSVETAPGDVFLVLKCVNASRGA